MEQVEALVDPHLGAAGLPSTITTHAGFGYYRWPLDDRGSLVTGDRQCRDLCYLAPPETADAALTTC